ncbi:hypothetical protein [Nostoc sp. FACHB-110]|uniref:hypothetical protein n=1 Tax=Nostoc sp. FACHB-110 TaxID=2692834 RepID=UPI001A7E33E5|nr:hypothetical protein [Nostoc sp. FACHB-110]
MSFLAAQALPYLPSPKGDATRTRINFSYPNRIDSARVERPATANSTLLYIGISAACWLFYLGCFKQGD